MLRNLKPKSLEDVKVIEQKLKSHKEGILQYKKNLKMGILRGINGLQSRGMPFRQRMR